MRTGTAAIGLTGKKSGKHHFSWRAAPHCKPVTEEDYWHLSAWVCRAEHGINREFSAYELRILHEKCSSVSWVHISPNRNLVRSHSRSDAPRLDKGESNSEGLSCLHFLILPLVIFEESVRRSHGLLLEPIKCLRRGVTDPMIVSPFSFGMAYSPTI